MSFNSAFTAADPFRPMLNVGEPWDSMTGTYYIGKYGDSICSGGLSHLVGWAARANLFKTALMENQQLTALERYTNAEGGVYDTELRWGYTV